MHQYIYLTKQIDYYLSIYKDNEYLLLYKELLSAFEIIVTQHNEISNFEKKLYNDGNTFIFKTTIIRLKPEYEIYNLILGKPELIKDYDKTILNKITRLLEIDNVTFDNIKNYILQNYKIV